MQNIEPILRKEAEELKKIVEGAKKREKNAPKGHLQIMKKGNRTEYYYRQERERSESKGGAMARSESKGSESKGIESKEGENKRCEDNEWESKGKCNGRYMRKKEIKLAKAIAQRDYDRQVIKLGEERIRAIELFLKKYKRTDLRNMYEKVNPLRRELIEASILSDEEYARRWEKVEYVGKEFTENEKEIITEKGERVRSKSEKIIADKLGKLGIPYRYEYPLFLDKNIKIYPDFTILKMPERKEIYLEHFGLMDSPEYVDTVLYKLNTYQHNGIYPGIQLFFTYETGKIPLDTRMLDKMLKELFEK